MTNKIRIKKWKPIYAALAAGQEFETQKGMKAVAPMMDHNLPMILIRFGYITPYPPYKLAKKFWDADLVSELRRRGYEVTAKKTVEL